MIEFYETHHILISWGQGKMIGANGGAPGVDGVTIRQIIDTDPLVFIEQLQEELRTKTYQPWA